MQLVRDVMTPTVIGVGEDATLVEAARQMRMADIGDVLVLDGDSVRGIVTDRDIVVRAIAADRDAAVTTVGEIASRDPLVLSLTNRRPKPSS